MTTSSKTPVRYSPRLIADVGKLSERKYLKCLSRYNTCLLRKLHEMETEKRTGFVWFRKSIVFITMGLIKMEFKKVREHALAQKN